MVTGYAVLNVVSQPQGDCFTGGRSRTPISLQMGNTIGGYPGNLRPKPELRPAVLQGTGLKSLYV
jgi:hypothetical protein